MPAPRSFEHEHISPEDLRRLEMCEARIRYRFRDPDYLLQALTHSSIKSIDKPCNERMEFLGDSVLGVVITEFLFNFYEDLTEGELTQIKSVVVSTNTLAEESQRLELDVAYSVGKGVTTKKQLPTSLLANVFEAVVGAIYLDGGIQCARDFCLRNLYHQIMAVNQNRHPLNYKSLLQQHLQKATGRTPTYRVVGESGPDHSKTFKVQAFVGKRKLGVGNGKNKKEAEQAAAQASLELLEEEEASKKPSDESEVEAANNGQGSLLDDESSRLAGLDEDSMDLSDDRATEQSSTHSNGTGNKPKRRRSGSKDAVDAEADA